MYNSSLHNKYFKAVKNKHIIFIPLISTFLIYLVFFPSITFSIYSSEIFPWAILFSVLFIHIYDFYTIFYVLILAVFSFFVFIFQKYNYFDSYEFFRSYFAYLNSFIIGAGMLQLSEKYIFRFSRAIRNIFYFLIILGLLQYFEIIDFLEPLISLLIPRGRVGTAGLRGITLLSSEPSRAAYELSFIYLAYRIIFIREKKYKIFGDFFLLFVQIFLIRSMTGIFYSFFLILILNFKNIKTFLTMFLAIILLFLIIFQFDFVTDIRALSGVNLLLKNLNSFEAFFNFLLDESGFRLISIIASLKYGIFHPFGGGIGNWEETSIDALQLTRYEPGEIDYFVFFTNSSWAPIRPTSYLFSLFLDVGIIGVIIFISIFYKVFVENYFKISLSTKQATLFFIFYLITYGDVGNPVPWVCFAFILKYEKIKSPRPFLRNPKLYK